MSGQEQGLVLDFRILIGVRYDEAARVFVSYSPAFELYSQGQTQMRALEAMKDAINGYIAVAIKKNVLAEVLNQVLPRLKPGERIARQLKKEHFQTRYLPTKIPVSNFAFATA